MVPDKEVANLQSQVISFLRFPLIVAVVAIHSQPHTLNISGVF